MPNTETINQQTSLSEAPANDDKLAIWDTSASAMKALLAGYARRAKVELVTASGAITPNAIQLITLNLGTAIALTITGSPTVGDILVIYRKGSGAVTHTVDVAGGITWEGTNDRANFADDGDWLIAIAESATRWITIQSGFTFS